jgi:N-acetylneuraminic acid mutarotase
VWGGRGPTFTPSGASYDPVSKTWTMLPVGPLTARESMAAVWSTTTDELLIFAGSVGTTKAYADATGAAYKPATNTWRTLSLSPLKSRALPSSIWNGSRMVVYGGDWTWYPNAQHDDAATYDPLTDTWLSIRPAHAPGGSFEYDGVASAMAGSLGGGAVMFYGGVGDHPSHHPVNGGFAWSTADGVKTFSAWTPEFPDATRAYGVTWFADPQLYIWGGAIRSTASTLSPWVSVATGASYDTRSKTFSPMPTAGAPRPRTEATVVWTGDRAIVWGGRSSTTTIGYAYTWLSDGGVFYP